MIKSPIWQRNLSSSGAIRLALVLGLNMVIVQSHADLSLTGDEKRNYIASLDTPQVQAIREYVNNCLSGVGEMGYPCEPDHEHEGNSIKEQPRDHVDGRFALLRVDPFNSRGEIYAVMFQKPPHLVAHIWVYQLGGVRSVIRSFLVDKMSLDKRLKIARSLQPHLQEHWFTR
jgi:hypothetical protein